MSKPEYVLQSGTIKMRFWKNQWGYSIDLRKSYKNKNGEWTESKYYYRKDLDKLQQVCLAAIQWLDVNAPEEPKIEPQGYKEGPAIEDDPDDIPF